MAEHFKTNTSAFWQLFKRILAPEAKFYQAVIVYSIAISLMTLAIPVSVQVLVDTITNIALPASVILISVTLFLVLIISGILYALRTYTMELFTRRIYARLSSEMAMTALQAGDAYFEKEYKVDLFNRYFDIMSLKRNVPYLLNNAFSLILQGIIGFTLVSFYHFYFFIFCVLLILLMLLVWKIWGWKCIITAFDLSEAKHRTGAWLQSMGVNSSSLKTPALGEYALKETNKLIHEHIDRQAEHFRYTFLQQLSALFLYALSSSVLLGMGGVLVIQGELSLGQLVSAELILSAIFFALPQLAGYLQYFYYTCAAIEEIGRFTEVPTETPDESGLTVIPENPQLSFNEVNVSEGQYKPVIDLQISGQQAMLIRATTEECEFFSTLLMASISPSSGYIEIAGNPIERYQKNTLREHIQILDRPTLLPVTIKKYLQLHSAVEETMPYQPILELLQLDTVIARLGKGFDTKLSHRGWPLSLQEALCLKLATAFFKNSQVVILGHVYDALPAYLLDNALLKLAETGTRVCYFTLRNDLSSNFARANITPLNKADRNSNGGENA